jgi:hypothetical protein
MGLLMKYKTCFFTALLPVFLLFSVKSHAQILDATDTSGGNSIIQSFQKNAMENSDTVLSMQHLKDSLDILDWKKNREFAYMHFLDSLLRHQKNVKFDTVSVDEKSGKIKRASNASRTPSSIATALNSWPLRIFFWSLALFFIAFLSYKIFFKSGVFVRKKKPLAEPEENSLLELNELSEYDFAISEAENKNEFNVALRYLFLKTLKNLSDKSDINFAAEKTNSDYLMEMSHHANFEDFKKLTRNYEYVWYGKFFIDKEQYQKLKKDFNSFNKNV